ncbi:MAG: universal stress protein, partial [Archangium sp.]
MAQLIRRILVPTDFSEHSRRALEHALSLAEAMGASVDLLHVWEPPWNLTADAVSMMAGVANSSVETEALAQAGRELHAWVERYGASPVPLHPRLEAGP